MWVSIEEYSVNTTTKQKGFSSLATLSTSIPSGPGGITRSVKMMSNVAFRDWSKFMASLPLRAEETVKLRDSRYSHSVNLKSLSSSTTSSRVLPGNTSAIFTMSVLSADALKALDSTGIINRNFLAGGVYGY